METTMTKAQLDALRNKFDQHPDGAASFGQFVGRVLPTIGCDGAVTVPWCGMWLCVERDGYTHT